MTAALFIIQIVGLLLLGLVAYKLRKVHIATIELTDKTRDIHLESRHLYGEIQAYLDLVRILDMQAPLPRLRGWAASPDFLLYLAQHALKHSPSTMVECSSGASTVVLARCAQLNGAGHVFSLENDPKFAQITRDHLENAGLSDWATVIDAPLEALEGHPGHRWYRSDAASSLPAIGMLVVDGPPEHTCELARYPALPILQARFSPVCHVFVDDAARQAESEMVRRWTDETRGAEVSQVALPAEKGCVHLVFRRTGQ